MQNYPNLFVIDHPLILHKLGQLRDNRTNTRLFRGLIQEMSIFLVYEASRQLALEEGEVEAWSGTVKVKKVKSRDISLVPIMRAGNGMLSGALRVFPEASVHFVGIVRSHDTAQPSVYYNKPSIKTPHMAILLDPMLATGGSLSEALTLLKKQDIQNIIVVCVIVAPEGYEYVQKMHPDIKIYCASLDSHLDEKKYIIPGLGDAGDRLFGT